MKKILMPIIWLIAFLAIVVTPALADDGAIPVPVFTDVMVRGSVSYDSTTGLYTYTYSIGNPATNTGVIQDVWLDIRRPQFGEKLSSDGLSMIYRGVNHGSFDEEIAGFGNPEPMVPVGLVGPDGWAPNIGARGAVYFAPGTFGPQIKPGEERSGFQVISRGLPGIREATIEPDWIFVATENEVSKEDSANARRISKSLQVHKTTIGPTAPSTAGFAWGQLNTNIPDYITRSASLGWLNDAALADALREKIGQARDFFGTDPSQAKVRLNEFMALIDQATASQITSEARGLLYFNALDLKNRLPDTIPEPVSILNLTPEKSEFPIGTMYTLTATYTEERGSEVQPLSNEMIELRILAGPNEGMPIESQMTDETGKAVFTYTSTLVGTDHLVALYGQTPAKRNITKGIVVAFNDPGEGQFPGMPENQASLIDAMPGYLVLAQNDYSDLIPAYMTASGVVEVNWTAGPDLTIPLFIPPHLTTQGGNPMFISDETKNIGELPSVPSVTRYYISPTKDFDPAQAIVVGERQVLALGLQESSMVGDVPFTVPSGLPQGEYYLTACADATNQMVETDEGNNCASNEYAIIMEVSELPQCIDNLTARVKSIGTDNKIQLTWSPQSDAQCYNIYRSTDPVGIVAENSQIAACHVTDYATYLDEGLVTNTTYYYRVSKVSNSVETCLSNTASTTTTPR